MTHSNMLPVLPHFNHVVTSIPPWKLLSVVVVLVLGRAEPRSFLTSIVPCSLYIMSSYPKLSVQSLCSDAYISYLRAGAYFAIAVFTHVLVNSLALLRL